MGENPEIPIEGTATAEPLTLDEGEQCDYTLHKNHDSVWVTVDAKISVRLLRTHEGVIVDLFKYGDENESLTSTLLEFSEVEDGESN
jgi:hypothetical protein